jgi:hypothetical protein
MTQNEMSQQERSKTAQQAWLALPHGGHDAIRLRVHCSRNHDVAVVYATDVGRVYVAPIGAHSHGSRDRIHESHGDQKAHHWFDLLTGDLAAGDALPAWCDCGQRSLSRAAVEAWLAAGEHRVVID